MKGFEGNTAFSEKRWRRTGEVKVSNRGIRRVKEVNSKTGKIRWIRLPGRYKPPHEGEIPKRCPKCNAGLVATEVNVRCPRCRWQRY